MPKATSDELDDEGQATAGVWLREVLAALEQEFVERFGDRWTPEVAHLFDAVSDGSVKAARAVDAGLATFDARNTTRRLLSNGVTRR